MQPDESREERRFVDKTVLLVDFENIAIRFQESNLSFPARELIERAKQAGPLEAAIVFIPPNITPDSQRWLRLRGYIVVSAPNIKVNGSDTVDHTLIDFCRLLSAIPDIQNFVIASSDLDMIDGVNAVKMRGKIAIGFDIAEMSRSLRHAFDKLLPLPAIGPRSRKNQSQPGFCERKGRIDFASIVQKLKHEKLAFPTNEQTVLFLVEIVRILPNTAKAEHARKFKDLVKTVWVELEPQWAQKGFLQSHCRKALKALLNNTEVLTITGVGHEKHYVFNSGDSFYNTLQP